MSDLTTKEKILENSHKLFAEKGFNGVSIREIAKECDVNIAAINYHFKNKENLYLATIRSSLEQSEAAIQSIYNELSDRSIENFSLAVYKFFKQHSEDLKTAFKLVISSDKHYDSLGEGETIFKGPPGGEFFYECLAQEFPKAKQEDILWAVRTIITQVIHRAMMSCNPSVCEYLKSTGGTGDIFQKDVERLVRVVKADLA